MRKQLLVLATLVLFLQLAPLAAQERTVDTTSDALWRFDTHG